MPKYDSPPFTILHPVDGEHGKPRDSSAPSRNMTGVEDHPTSPPVMYNPFFTGRSRTPGHNDGFTSPIDRQEIIRKIKIGDIRASHLPVEDLNDVTRAKSRSRSRSPSAPPEHSLSPSRPDRSSARPQESQDQNALGLEISRPRSALHRGDFREQEPSSPWRLDGREQHQHQDPSREWQIPISTSPVVPWHHAFPANAHRRSLIEPSSPLESSLDIPTRPRAVSHASLSSSFAYQPPTSPLVHQSNAADIPDLEPRARHPRRSSPDRRRHTYSPRLLHQSRSVVDYTTTPRSTVHHHATSLRRETTFPCQAHQPRRSIGSFHSLPQTPYLGARRPSISDGSPLQHAPMVGSYEESILRGRMSTPASKPLNFVAQIGVLGKGDCKPSLKCPPHVSVPFPAVFYSYRSGLAVDPEPSPYVGMVDLENSLEKPTTRDGSRKRRRHYSPHNDHDRTSLHSHHSEVGQESQLRRRKQQKASRRSQSPKEPTGGSYRIPQQGQIQIVLKNPNKTAVKLFLVPYDLSDMEPGQKTFIRQRSYSAGPIIDMPISSRRNYGTDRPEASLNSTNDLKDRPILRYLIHLNFCCPSKNRFYLYQNIRVVFANRVPDGKEKLRSEIQMPEPRFSAYKPGREATAGLNTTPDLAKRRRSAVMPGLSATDSAYPGGLSASIGSELFGNNQLFVKSFDNAPYHLSSPQGLPTLESRPASRGLSDDVDMDDVPQSPTSPLATRIKKLADEEPRGESNEALVFSREASRERVGGSGRGESLLSRRLKDLEMRGGGNGTTEP